ncbi:hypothetical protein JOQ06_004036 [Pogonophryne albipinna]|uniref:Uncharacterized protein n=1 Tax=Pogonophryne albipinna TaxID=1090488 RepID=A0AAD6F600_9TELE|nr:hypothetical protein JOQ06_004036 [Pogonophryne albipinna]
MTKSLDFLLANRTQDNEILETNIFVFATANSDSNIRGSDCLRKCAQLCDAKHPETLTSTQLRKQIATLIQIMNLQDHEMEQVAKFMGHDIRVHREYYRLTENTMQLAKMSKLLMAIEMDTNVYKGKSLDDLDLDLGKLSRAKKQKLHPEPWDSSHDSDGVAVSKNPETLTLGDFNKDGSMSSKRRGKRQVKNVKNAPTDPLQGRFFFLKSYDGQKTKYIHDEPF